MVYYIRKIGGIGPAYAERLAALKITTTDELLRACTTREARREVARASGLSERQIIKWTKHADLMRVRGVGAEYAELLEAAGVNSVKELCSRNPTLLSKRMLTLNAKWRLTRNVPGPVVVGEWIEHARGLESILPD